MMTKGEYIAHVAALVMAELCAKSASGSDFRHNLEFWDELSDLATMAHSAASFLAAIQKRDGNII